MRRAVPLLLVCALALCCSSAARAQDPAADPGEREIVPVAGDLFLVRDGQARTVFLATPGGIVLGDPLSRTTALWLAGELRTRFGTDVRYVVHTSHHFSRAAGSSVFSGTADVVAHSAINDVLAKAQRDTPDDYRFALRRTVQFRDQILISLAGQSVRVISLPTSKTPETAVLFFPRERVVFAATLHGLETASFSFGASPPSDAFTWIDTLAPLEFDTILLGDGRTLSRVEFDDLSKGLASLRAAVATGVRNGRSVSDIQSSAPTVQLQSGLPPSDAAPLVSALYRAHRAVAVHIYAGAATSYVSRSSAFCESWTSCSGGGAVPAARFGLSGTLGYGFDVLGELTFAGQTWSARTNPSRDEEAAGRRSRGSLLLRFTPWTSKLSFAVLGGVSSTVDKVQGLDRVTGKLVPTGGFHPFELRTSRMGITAGADVEFRISRGIAIRLPVRVTQMGSVDRSTYTDSNADIQAGVDVTFRLFHRVTFR